MCSRAKAMCSSALGPCQPPAIAVPSELQHHICRELKLLLFWRLVAQVQVTRKGAALLKRSANWPNSNSSSSFAQQSVMMMSIDGMLTLKKENCLNPKFSPFPAPSDDRDEVHPSEEFDYDCSCASCDCSCSVSPSGSSYSSEDEASSHSSSPVLPSGTVCLNGCTLLLCDGCWHWPQCLLVRAAATGCRISSCSNLECNCYPVLPAPPAVIAGNDRRCFSDGLLGSIEHKCFTAILNFFEPMPSIVTFPVFLVLVGPAVGYVAIRFTGKIAGGAVKLPCKALKTVKRYCVWVHHNLTHKPSDRKPFKPCKHPYLKAIRVKRRIY